MIEPGEIPAILTKRSERRNGDLSQPGHGHPASASFSASGSASAAALREFTLNGTDHASHHEQGSMIRCYIAWRNRDTNAGTINRANVA